MTKSSPSDDNSADLDKVRALRAMRLRSQGLGPEGHRRWNDVGEVALGMLAMQAQDPAAVLWTLACRAGSDPTEDDIRSSFESAEVVRNRPSRGTLQVTHNRDITWLSALCTPRSVAASIKRRTNIELTDEAVQRAVDAIAEALSDGSVRTRADLGACCDDAGVPLESNQLSHVLRLMTERMEIIFAGAPTRDDFFVHPSRSIDDPRDLSGDDALGELARRFFDARGPATVHCLSKWSNLSMPDSKRAIAAAGGDLEAHEMLGSAQYVSAGSPAISDVEVDEILGTPLLLGAFDEYLIGYDDRDSIIAAEHFARVVPGRNGMFKPIVVVDGQIVGVWSRKLNKSGVKVTIEPFDSLSSSVTELLEERAAAYGRFLERPSSVEFLAP